MDSFSCSTLGRPSYLNPRSSDAHARAPLDSSPSCRSLGVYGKWAFGLASIMSIHD